jgi:hypothetical protein
MPSAPLQVAVVDIGAKKNIGWAPNAPTSANEAVQCLNMTTLRVRCLVRNSPLVHYCLERRSRELTRSAAMYKCYFRRCGGPAAPARIVLPFATRYKRDACALASGSRAMWSRGCGRPPSLARLLFFATRRYDASGNGGVVGRSGTSPRS